LIKQLYNINWKSVPTPERTIFYYLNQNLLKLQENHKDSFPDLSNSNTLLVGSDYSGRYAKTPYLVYSFLLTSIDAWFAWEPKRLEIRRRVFTDSRRMSFKRLNDSQRQGALLLLLEAANDLEGLSFSIAINNKCASPFAGEYPLDLLNPDFKEFKKWKKTMLIKAFVIIHFIGFLLAGLSGKGQNVLWFTDEDAIAANEQRLRELTRLFSWVSSQYLTFNLGHLRCGTSRCDNGSNQIEDFLAIPDLIAGAINEQLNLKNNDPDELSDVFWIHRPDYSEKSKKITWWFSDSRQSLKRLLCVVNPSGNGLGHTISWFHFHDQS
jgi:hypothetical protein